MSLLRFEQVTLVRGGRELFHDLSFQLAPGELLHVCGPNGAGKSSLIRLAAGLLKSSAGRVEAAPFALADDRPALDGERSLKQALDFWAQLRGREAETPRALAALGLESLSNVPVRLLSAGQIKRAGVARVIASGACLWLLDEPLNGLDTDSADRLTTLIRGHIEQGGAVLAASHLNMPGKWRTLDLAR